MGAGLQEGGLITPHSAHGQSRSESKSQPYPKGCGSRAAGTAGLLVAACQAQPCTQCEQQGAENTAICSCLQDGHPPSLLLCKPPGAFLISIFLKCFLTARRNLQAYFFLNGISSSKPHIGNFSWSHKKDSLYWEKRAV